MGAIMAMVVYKSSKKGEISTAFGNVEILPLKRKNLYFAIMQNMYNGYGR